MDTGSALLNEQSDHIKLTREQLTENWLPLLNGVQMAVTILVRKRDVTQNPQGVLDRCQKSKNQPQTESIAPMQESATYSGLCGFDLRGGAQGQKSKNQPQTGVRRRTQEPALYMDLCRFDLRGHAQGLPG